MGNAHSYRVDNNPHCASPKCGPIPSVVRKPKHNIIASVRSAEEAKVCNETPTPSSSSRSKFLIKTIQTTIRDLFDPGEPERLPPKRHSPKQLLFGCHDTDEHYDYIDRVCQEVASLHGKEGLEAMGFEFRVVHHNKTCSCAGVVQPVNDDDLTDSEADPDEIREGYMESSEDGDDYGQFEDGSEEDEAKSEYMVPIGSPLKIPEEEQKLDTISNGPTTTTTTSYSNPTASYTSSNFSRKDSALSLFSLATHNTDFSSPTANTGTTTEGDNNSGRPPRRNNNNNNSSAPRNKSARFPLATISSSPNVAVMEQDSCALRLHHILTDTLLTPENHTKYVADGKMYDELARLCMEYSQQVMMEQANLEWVSVSKEPSFGVLATKDYFERRRQRQAGNQKHKTLLVVTGKGEVQAGIFSRRHLLVTSMEAATALPFIRGALERDMDIVMLDPNALGYRNGMDVVEQSLEHFFFEDGKAVDDKEEVYILAHSMAGAQIVRFFIDNSSCHHSRPTTPSSSSCASSSVSDATNSASNNNGETTTTTSVVDKRALRSHFLQRVRAFALTDSNHNINWIKSHPQLMEALTGPPSLYIKSHKVHEKAKELGQTHHDCQFWRHRFGDIKTLWAGTHEHALTNYTARAHIWMHFDEFLNKPQPLQLPPRCPPVPATSSS